MKNIILTLLTVISLPVISSATIGPITGASNICAGSTISLSDTTAGGTWSSSNTALATVGSASGIVTGVVAGSVTITYTTGTGFVTAGVVVNPLPAAFAVVGGGGLCAGGSGVHVGLSMSQTGITYQLWYAGGPVSVVLGSGAPIDFGSVSGAGAYTATATNNVTGCTATMTGSAVVTINPSPTAYAVTGGGSYCAGGTGVHVTLSGSDPGITYQLMIGGTVIATAVPGSGLPIDFGAQTVAGTYSIYGTNPMTGCAAAMSGSAVIVVNPSPAPLPVTGSIYLCAGTTTALTDATPGGSWSSAIPSVATIDHSTGLLTGVSTGSTGITYVLPTGCYTTTTIGVSFSPPPIGVAGTLCAGGTSSVYDAATGGVWASGNTAIATVGTLSGTVTGVSSGTCTITYSLGSGCTTTRAVSVMPSPAAILGGSPVCPGGHETLTDVSTGGTWTSTNPGIATVDPATGLVLSYAPGTTTIDYSFATGCYVSKVVTVTPLPSAITGPTSVCQGSSIVLSDATGGGLWSSGTTSAVVGSLSGIVTGVTAGTATITYTYGSGCSAVSLITINPSPATITGLASVCSGGTISLSDATPGGAWSSSMPTVALPNSTTGSVTGYTVGTATISYTTTNGCVTTHSLNVTPGVCSGTPTGGTAIASNPYLCPGFPETLSLSGTSSGCGVTLQWQSSPDGITFSDIAGATFPTYNYNAALSQYFRCKAICSTTGLYAYSTPVAVNLQSNIASHTIIPAPDSSCSGPDFYISACGTSDSFNVTTWFGDGTSTSTPLTSTSVCHADIVHGYNLPGTYSVKQVLFIGTIPQDSVSFSYEYQYCRTIPVKLYMDANSDCIFDTGDQAMLLPVLTEIDSNGIPVDTISSTSGFYYKALGLPGTVYAFRIISPSGIIPTCPATGVLYDTIQSSTVYRTVYFALNCSGSTSFDMQEHVSTNTGRHMQTGTIIVNNAYCLPQDAVITLHISPKYVYGSAYPVPTTVSGNTLTWSVSGITSTSFPTISYTVNVPDPWSYTTWLIPGDTVMSNYVTVRTSTGSDTTNVITKNDTVKSSYDPNEMSVSPAGYILPCTRLQYTIRFQNTGNDTAHNITVMDTLSGNLDVRSLQMEIASSAMNIAIINDGLHNIAKFDFPNINLPDSTNHDQCTGMVVFNIKTKSGLTDGTTIFNHAGIFFDDNPAVLTDTIENVIGISPIVGRDSVCIAAHDTLSDNSTGGVWSVSNTTASISAGLLTGVAAGLDTVVYTMSNTCTSKTATKIIRINSLPATGVISGTNVVCAGSSIILSDTTTGGVWSSSNPSDASIDTMGLIAGVSAGTATISYARSNGCGTAAATKAVTVNPVPAMITGAGAICAGATAGLSEPTTGGSWISGNPAAATVGSGTGMVTGVTAGTSVLTYTLPTSCYVTHAVTVNTLPTVYHVIGGGAYCAGDTGLHLTLSGSAVGTNYLLYYGATSTGTFHGTGGVLDFGLQTLAGTYTATATNTATGCFNIMADSAIIFTNPAVTPAVNLSTSAADTICAGTPATFTATAVNGGAVPLYQWEVNGTGVAFGNTYSFLPANGDVVKVLLTSNALCAVPDTASNALTMHVELPLSPSVSLTKTPNTPISSGETLTLTAVVSGYGYAPTYQWMLNGTYLAGATNSTYTSNLFENNDSITCIVSTGNICGYVLSNSAVIIKLSDVGIKSLAVNNEFSVFPNPAKTEFSINYNFAIKEDALLQVTDLSGRAVIAKNLDVHNKQETISIRSLASGMYLYRVTQNNILIAAGKIVKE